MFDYEAENIDKFLYRWIFFLIFCGMLTACVFPFFGLFCFGRESEADHVRQRVTDDCKRHWPNAASVHRIQCNFLRSALNYALLTQSNTLNISCNVTNRMVHYHIISVSHLLQMFFYASRLSGYSVEKWLITNNEIIIEMFTSFVRAGLQCPNSLQSID